MAKEFEIHGAVEVPLSLTEDEFNQKLLGFIESQGWWFGGGIREMIDGYYINADGTRGVPLDEE